MCWHIENRLRAKGLSCAGQASVEAAFLIPVLFVSMLLLIQPGIILYDRVVMEGAAAEGCRLLATQTESAGFTQDRCSALIKRRLGAIPPQDLFHMHQDGCSWEIELDGDERSAEVGVTIRNKVKLLPLFDGAGTLLGLADGQGCLSIEVVRRAQTQPEWVQKGKGIDPQAWTGARD